MLYGFSAKLAIDFLEGFQNLVVLEVPERLVLHIAIYIGRRNVRVVIAAHVNLKSEMFILVYKVNKPIGLKERADSS